MMAETDCVSGYGRYHSSGSSTKCVSDCTSRLAAHETTELRKVCSFLSFIHYGDLYSASSRLLCRSAPDPCMAKKKSFEARVKCVRKNPGSNRCAKVTPFHTERQTTENARAWVVEVRAKGTKSNPCSNERSELRPLVPRVGQQRSQR